MKNEQELTTDLQLSRRRFFRNAGTFLAGAAVTAAGCTALTGKKHESCAPVATWPLPYKKLDVELVRGRAFAGYYKGK